MSKVQSRRTVSLNRSVFNELRRRAQEEGMSLSEFATETLQQQWKREDEHQSTEIPPIEPCFLAPSEDVQPEIPEYKRLQIRPGDWIVTLDLVVTAKSRGSALHKASVFCFSRNQKPNDFLLLSADRA